MLARPQCPGASIWIAVVVAALLASGCETRSDSRKRYEALTQRERTKVDDFDSAFNFLTGMHQFDPEQAATQASYHLNKWLAGVNDPKPWKRDPLLDRIPAEFAPLVSEEEVGRKNFNFADTYYIEFNNLLADLADWTSKETEPRMQAWFDEKPDQLSDSELEQLIVAHRLFDWVVRDIQLDPTPEQPKRSAAGVGGASSRPLRPSQEMRVGPGYAYLPRQTLLYGHGDKWNRSRVFIALARQRGIDAVILAADPTLGETRPWLTGVLIGERLYLFDAEMGMAIPNEDGRGIATLKDARTKPQLLDNLRAGDREYAFKSSDLERVVALIDASPEAVSFRMAQLEASLTGDRRIVLTVKPSPLAAQVRKCGGIANVALWTAPFDAVLFQKTLDERIADQDPSASIFAAERFLLAGNRPIMRGRRLHLRGVFQGEDETEESAKAAYMGFRVDEETLSKLATDERVQKSFSLRRSVAETDVDWARRLYAFESELRKGKQNASYWIGLVHYESGDLSAAVDWLKRRTIDAYEKGWWKDSATYNLARAYEAQGKYEEARSVLLTDESRQALGNRIRARLIREWRDAKTSDTSGGDAKSSDS